MFIRSPPITKDIFEKVVIKNSIHVVVLELKIFFKNSYECSKKSINPTFSNKLLKGIGGNIWALTFASLKI